MATQAKWHKFSWGYSASRIISVESLSTGHSISVERNEDKEGEPATQSVALELVTLSFEYTLTAAAGCNPRREYEQMNECLGVHAPFYLSGSPYLANEMMLKSVNASDYCLDAKGRVVRVKVSVEFEEYAEDASGLKMNKVNRDALRPGVRGGNTRTSALDIGCTSAQKSKRIKGNPQMKGW